MSKKPVAGLSPGLVSIKGQATAVDSMPSQLAGDSGALPSLENSKDSKSSAPLNFKVDAEFRRRFRQRAAEADLKLNELLREALDAWEQVHRLKGPENP